MLQQSKPTITLPSRHVKPKFDDLSMARRYLAELGRELQRAAVSPDPRVISLALALVEVQRWGRAG